MPPAAASTTSVHPRSPLIVRALLLGACGVGLLGLSVPDSPAVASSTIAVQAAASTSFLDGNDNVRTRIATPQRVVVHRAARSRRVAVAKRTRHVSGRWLSPSYGGIVSPFGMRWGRLHKGVDFSAHYGDPIRAVGDGVVVGAGYLGDESGYGEITLIRHANGFVSAYAHQSRIFVHSGDRVTAGDIIGLVGSTGHSFGPHLHFEIRTGTHDGQINPVPWLRAHGVYV